MATKSQNANMRKTKDSVNLHESGPAEDVWIGHCAVCLMGMGQNAIFCVLAVCLGCTRKTVDSGPTSPRPRIEKSSNPILTQWKPK